MEREFNKNTIIITKFIAQFSFLSQFPVDFCGEIAIMEAGIWWVYAHD